MKSPPVRFSLDGDKLFDYATSRYVPAEGIAETHDGYWNLTRVAQCIRDGQGIEVAYLSNELKEQLIAGEGRVLELEQQLAAAQQEHEQAAHVLNERIKHLEAGGAAPDVLEDTASRKKKRRDTVNVVTQDEVGEVTP